MDKPQKINIKPEKLENVFCSDKECQSPFFEKTYVLKKIPLTISPTGRAFIQPMELYVCRDCGGIIGEMTPPGAVVGDAVEVKTNEVN